MFDLKPLSKDAIESALAKAERHRFLNEPDEAESICLDVLEVDPDNQPATGAAAGALRSVRRRSGRRCARSSSRAGCRRIRTAGITAAWSPMSAGRT